MSLDLPPVADLVPFPTPDDVAATLDSRYPQVTIDSPGPDVIRDAVVAGAATQALVLAIREAVVALDRSASSAATAAGRASSTASSALLTAAAASQDAATAADAAIAAQSSSEESARASRTKYTKPSTGIPASDLAATVRQDLATALGTAAAAALDAAAAADAAIAAEGAASEAAQTALAKYTRPSTGIPASDLAVAVRRDLSSAATTAAAASQDAAAASLAAAAAQTAADEAGQTALSRYAKPPTGIPSADLTSAVRQDLTAGRTAVQPQALNSYAPLVGGVVPAQYLPPGTGGTGGGGGEPSTTPTVIDGGGASTSSTSTNTIDGGGATA